MSHVLMIYSGKCSNTSNSSFLAKLSVIKALGLSRNTVSAIDIDDHITFMPYNTNRHIDDINILSALYNKLNLLNPDLVIFFNGISISRFKMLTKKTLVSFIFSPAELTHYINNIAPEDRLSHIMYFGDELNAISKASDHMLIKNINYANPFHIMESDQVINTNGITMFSNLDYPDDIELNKLEYLHELKNIHLKQFFQEFNKLNNEEKIININVKKYLKDYNSEDSYYKVITSIDKLWAQINSSKIIVLFMSVLPEDNLSWLLANILASKAVVISNNHTILNNMLGNSSKRLFNNYSDAMLLINEISQNNELRENLLQEQKNISKIFSHQFFLEQLENYVNVKLTRNKMTEAESFFKVIELSFSEQSPYITKKIKNSKKGFIYFIFYFCILIIYYIIDKIISILEKILFHILVFLGKYKFFFKSFKKISRFLPSKSAGILKNKYYNSRYHLNKSKKSLKYRIINSWKQFIKYIKRSF